MRLTDTEEGIASSLPAVPVGAQQSSVNTDITSRSGPRPERKCNHANEIDIGSRMTLKNELLRYAAAIGNATIGKGVIKERFVRWKLERVLQGRRRVAVSDERRDDVVVSLTSWSERIDLLPLALLTLAEQSIRPASIEVWMTEEDLRLVPSRERAVFDEMGVSYRTSQDYGPHKKWLNTLREREDPYVVTADDDILYPRHWLRTLLSDLEDSRDISVAHRCHRITFEDGDTIAPYDNWKKDVPAYGEVSPSLFATGCGGQVLRRDWLPDGAMDTERILAHCPRNDDIWLACALLSAGIPRKKSSIYLPVLEITGSYESSLQHHNVVERQNDVQLRDTMDAFGLTAADFRQ